VDQDTPVSITPTVAIDKFTKWVEVEPVGTIPARSAHPRAGLPFWCA
jgi:hypothetical protein